MLSAELAVLKRARELLTRREHWESDVIARNARGDIVAATSPEAQSFCLLGGLIRAVDDICGDVRKDKQAFSLHHRVLCRVWVMTNGTSLSAYNASKGHKGVLRLLDRLMETF